MEKKWANKDKYHPSNGVLEPRVQMPKAKGSVRIVLAWGERKVTGGVAGGEKPARPVWRQQGASLVFMLVTSLSLLQEIVVLVVGLETLQVVSLLGVLPLVLNTRIGRSRGSEMERRNDPRSSFRGFGPPQVERVGSLIVVTVVMFVEVALL
jgi:hypothetical protein